MVLKRTAFWVLLIIALALAGTGLYNRVKWGTWFPFSDPARIEFRDRRYYPGAGPNISESTRFRALDKSYYWGRGLYVTEEEYQKLDRGQGSSTYMTLFLEENGGYSPYVLSGGP